jgi:hypothetical protein
VKVKGPLGKRWRPAYTFTELTQLYERFAEAQVKKAKKDTGRDDIKPDSFASFVAERTDLCPHILILPNTSYWIETVNIFDSEMGLTLPGAVDEIPALFWDALSIVRSSRAQVRKEEK